jgi:hypothetical protein
MLAMKQNVSGADVLAVGYQVVACIASGWEKDLAELNVISSSCIKLWDQLGARA